MNRDWESWLATASGPASATEEEDRDRTERRIKDAVRAAPDLPMSVRVYAKGSYANGTNVRRDADVDIAVEWTDTFTVETWGKTAGMTAAELGYKPATRRTTPEEFRGSIERAMSAAFGTRVDTSPDKHIGVAAGSGTLDADVVPCFALHRYDQPGVWVDGQRLYPKSGGYLDNYPRQNQENSVTKNSRTSKRYKQIVRCMKRLVGELYDDALIPRDYPGYLLECLVFNVPNDRFGNLRRYDDMQGVLRYLWNGLQDADIYLTWTEPSRLTMLFRGRPDRVPRNALNVVDKAWDRIGIS